MVQWIIFSWEHRYKEKILQREATDSASTFLMKSWESYDAFISLSFPLSRFCFLLFCWVFLHCRLDEVYSPLLLALSIKDAHLLAQLHYAGSPLHLKSAEKRENKDYRQKCTCSRVKAMLSSVRQRQELWPRFCSPPSTNPWFCFPGHFLGFKTVFFARKGKRYWLSNVLVSTSMRSLSYIGFSFRAWWNMHMPPSTCKFLFLSRWLHIVFIFVLLQYWQLCHLQTFTF